MLLELKTSFAKPFVKWAGGKRQLLPNLLKAMPNSFNRYFEPFLGGGALFFELKPTFAIVNDINSEIINLYLVIKNNVELLIKELKDYKNTSEYFYYIRNMDRNKDFKNLSPITRAARVLYLNKTCYNGLYRVNSKGEFNVPFGFYKSPNIIDVNNLFEVSLFLNRNSIELLNTDFEKSLQSIRADDFVYFDPPYEPIVASSNFTNYTPFGFNRNEQIRLKKICDKLNNMNVKFLLSNSESSFIMELYKNYKIEIVQASRNINSIGSRRSKINEVLIRNY